MPELYYTPPTNEIFEEVKKEAMLLWEKIDSDNNKYGYASEKKDRIRNIKNIGDNFMTMVAMFDIHNQRRLADVLSIEACRAVRERMIDGGQPLEYITF